MMGGTSSRRSLGYIVAVMLASAAVLHFTLPRYNAVPGSCDAGDVPLSDLALVRLYAAYPGDPVSLWQQHAATVPGAADSFSVAWDGRPLSVWVTAVDSAGNEGCRSAYQLGRSADVPTQPPTGAHWYDVAGRRVAGPNAPGVYLWRQGRRTGKVAVLR